MKLRQERDKKVEEKKETNLYFEEMCGMGKPIDGSSRVASVVGKMIQQDDDSTSNGDCGLPEHPDFMTPPLKRHKKNKPSGSSSGSSSSATSDLTPASGTAQLINGLKTAIESLKPSEAVQMRKLDIEQQKLNLLNRLFEKLGPA